MAEPVHKTDRGGRALPTSEATRAASIAEVIEPGHSLSSVTEKIARIVLRPGFLPEWLVGFTIAFAMVMMFLYAVTYLFMRGVGIWGVNIPVGWGFDIINFVWWIGIGHAGTLISAILLLFRQRWRMSIARFAEAMTLFAVACAAMYPVLHTGRPWLAYWLLPYPNSMSLWPQFRSPLIWDVFAVSTYGTVSIVFWYVGLIPDLATMRDKAKSLLVKRIYGFFALGWRGSAMHWQRYETASLLLAGLSTPLVVSVHTVVSFDFAVSLVPGWHATIFPPYFVAGAIYSGFAMVLTLVIPIRAYYGLEHFITMRHIQNMAKIMLATGLIVFYGLLRGSLHGVVQRQQLGRLHDLEQDDGPVLVGILVAHPVQRADPAAPLVQTGADEHPAAVPDCTGRQYRHVAGTLRHHRDQPGARLRALRVGHVLRDRVGLGHLVGHGRPVRVARVPVRALRADDLHVRDADDRAGRDREGAGGTLSGTSWLNWTRLYRHSG